ncbi:p21-carboxy-terminal region-binding protein (macronuclear) [Tetrahymena thermophila SB210]|uniref:p21-carboxy-terminal region-binding protein n=1 Tax=Tetrahymena thermophila (strain SB210) TaxID=312017 RepID=I7MMP6_TETTS|nr:p21-carboxy-terminal region-binding protein [Tetrahymena thermophila SB210]EAS06153.1 p21-carboxy-terminal region-binding protein [Tetrahymena thermophila SB210]|eukprot:XP_001026398.1 p21-carboxy-terminal region-binding protein [Tetrahymena thermophila SB210]
MSTNNKKSKLHKRTWEENDKKDNKKAQESQEEEDDEQIEDVDENEDDDQEEDQQVSNKKSKANKKNEKAEEGNQEEDDWEDEEDEEDDEDDDDLDSEDLIDITKKKNELEDEEEDEDDDDEEGEEGEEDEVLNVDFEFKDANETMFHSVKGLINGYLDGSDYNSSDLADIIVKQFTLGTFIVIDEEEDENQKKIREKAKLERETNVIGFSTFISAKQHENQSVVKEIIKFVNQKSEKFNNEADHKKLQNILAKNKVGLLINERIINVAPQAVPVLHTQLQEDYKWFKQNHQKEFKENFDFEYLLCITRCAKEVKGTQDPQQGQKKLKKEELDEYLYPKFEDFLLLEKAEIKFFFEAAQSKSQSGLSKKNMDEIKSKELNYKIIYLIKISDYFKSIPEMPLHLCD